MTKSIINLFLKIVFIAIISIAILLVFTLMFAPNYIWIALLTIPVLITSPVILLLIKQPRKFSIHQGLAEIELISKDFRRALLLMSVASSIGWNIVLWNWLFLISRGESINYFQVAGDTIATVFGKGSGWITIATFLSVYFGYRTSLEWIPLFGGVANISKNLLTFRSGIKLLLIHISLSGILLTIWATLIP